MKIVLLIDNLGSGGAQRQVVTLAKLFHNKDCDVTVLVYNKDDFFKNVLEESNIAVVELIHKNQLYRALTIRHFIRRNSPDAVISFMDTPNFFNCVAAIGRHHWKVITSERSCQEIIFKRVKNRVFNYFQRYSDYIVCNSVRARQMWLSHMPRYKSKLVTIYNAVTLDNLDSIYEPLKNGILHLVVAASYQGLKRPELVAKALTYLDTDLLCKLRIDWYGNKCIGTADECHYYNTEKIIENYHLGDYFKLHGPISNISDIMNQADCVGLFSQFEGLPNAICEAMLIGKPILMTKVSDYNELVDSSNGFLCEVDDVLSLAEALKQLLQCDASELLSKGKQSHMKAEKMFSEDFVIQQWLRAIS